MADEIKTPIDGLYELKARARKVQEAVLILGVPSTAQTNETPVEDSVRQDAMDCLEHIKGHQIS